MGKLLYEEKAYKIRGACFEVWKYLVGAFKESVVDNALDKGVFSVVQRKYPRISASTFLSVNQRRYPRKSASMAFSASIAFTLIELLIAISIFAIVAVALYSTFFAGISVWKKSGEGGNIYQDAKFVFDDIKRDLQNAIYLSKDEESIFTFSGEAEEISFITLQPVFLEEDISRKELVKVTYGFDAGKNQLISLKAEKSLGFDTEKAEKEILLDGVEKFTIFYCYDTGDEDDPYEWKEEWEDRDMRIPRGVKIISLIRSGGDTKDTLEFTKTIFIPIGVLGEREVGL